VAGWPGDGRDIARREASAQCRGEAVVGFLGDDIGDRPAPAERIVTTSADGAAISRQAHRAVVRYWLRTPDAITGSNRSTECSKNGAFHFLAEGEPVLEAICGGTESFATSSGTVTLL
jgi:hypothetical protein